jgi:hypothetical protein
VLSSLDACWRPFAHSPRPSPDRIGHADFKTTQIYINAHGELFSEEAAALEARMFGHTLGHNGASPP